MTEGHMTAIGPCCNCHKHFEFDPARVPSIPIDPLTGLPPDMDYDGNNVTPDPEAVERSVNQPVCPECIDRGNVVRKEKGQPLIPHEADNPPIF